MSIKISELPSASSVGASDVIPIVQGGTTKKAPAGLIHPTIATTINENSTNSEIAGAKAVYDNSLEVYSTTEQRIGTWIDNKPLYRVVIQTTAPNAPTQGSSTGKDIDCSAYNIETLIRQEGFCATTITGGLDFTDLPIIESSSSSLLSLKSFYHTDTKLLSISNSSTIRNGATVFITLEFTKTTD